MYTYADMLNVCQIKTYREYLGAGHLVTRQRATHGRSRGCLSDLRTGTVPGAKGFKLTGCIEKAPARKSDKQPLVHSCVTCCLVTR